MISCARLKDQTHKQLICVFVCVCVCVWGGGGVGGGGGTVLQHVLPLKALIQVGQ